MAAAFRQSASTSTDGTTSTTVAKILASSVLAGSRLLAFVEWGATGASDISTVGDNINGTGGWARVASSFANDTGDISAGEVWECKNSGAGTITVTVTFGVLQPFRGLCIHEVIGADTAVAALAAAAQLQTGTAVVSPDITPSSDGCYIFGACTQNSDSTTQPTAGGAFALRETPGNGSTTAICGSEDQVQGSAAAIHAAFNFATSKTATVHVVAIKAASPSSGGWVGSGSRRAPGQRGPFDARGFLLRRTFDYTPSAAPIVTVLQRKTLSQTGNHAGGRTQRGN